MVKAANLTINKLTINSAIEREQCQIIFEHCRA